MKKIKNLPELMLSKTYQDFIEILIIDASSRGQQLSYSSIARKAGFQSRSYVRAIALGKKKISAKSLHKFITGLGLTGDLAEFFRLLVELNEPQCRMKPTSEDKIKKLMENLRTRLLEADKTKKLKKENSLFQSRHLPKIYAALGTKDHGATIEEIQQRTGIAVSSLKPLLTVLLNAEIIIKSGSSFFPKETHLNLPHLTESEVFREFFLHSLSDASANAQRNLQSETALHFSSCFSVSIQDLPRLKQELRSVLSQFIDRSETPEGNKVVSLVCSLF